MSGDTRAVWLTRAQRDLCAHGDPNEIDVLCSRISEAWDAAPADPAEAVRKALSQPLAPFIAEGSDLNRMICEAVLRSLGWERGYLLKHPGVAASPETDTPQEAP